MDHVAYTDFDVEANSSKSTTYLFNNEAEWKFQLSKNELVHGGANYIYETAHAGEFKTTPARNRIASYASYKWYKTANNYSLSASASARKEMIDGSFAPWVYSGGMELFFFRSIGLKTSYSKNYKIPTFNDLYWPSTTYASGNPGLSPESGHSFQVGMEQRIKSSGMDISIEETYFSNEINNWIVWLPNDKGIWRPENKTKGSSTGVELKYRFAMDWDKFHIQSNGFYQYLDPKMIDKDETGATKENQQRYTPKHQFMASLCITYNKFQVGYNRHFYSERYYDYSKTLNAYTIDNAYASYVWNAGPKSDLNISFKVNNLNNEAYQVIAWYAMPMRNYELALNYKFKYQ